MSVQTAKGDVLWSSLEENGAFIPDTLKKILEVNKYDNVRALANFQPEDQDKIVAFMRNTLHLIIPEDEREQYYDIFKFKPDQFAMVPGHQLALKTIVRISKYFVNQSNGLVTSTASSTKRKSGNSTKTNNNSSVTDADIIDAKKKLDSNLTNYLKDKFVEFKAPFTLETKVEPDGNGSFKAEVTCPAKNCKKKINVGRIKTRWNPSNVFTHVRRVHFSTKDGAEDEKNQNNTMENYLEISAQGDGQRTEENSDDELVSSKKKSKKPRITDSDDENENPDDDLVTIGEETSEAAEQSSGEGKEKDTNDFL